MRIAYGSDFHLNAWLEDVPKSQWQSFLHTFVEQSFTESADVLFLAGDFSEALLEKGMDAALFFDLLQKRYGTIYAVLGNHDASLFDSEEEAVKTCNTLYPGIRFLANESVMLGNKRLFGATFWPSLSADALKPVARFFEGVEKFGVKAVSSQLRAHHRKSLAALERELTTHAESDFVLLTHFAPAPASYHRAQAYEIEAFCLAGDLLQRPRIRAWFHGHTHTECRYREGGSTVLCHACGMPTSKVRQNAPWRVAIAEIPD